MLEYQIQNSNGKVYGRYPFPEPPLLNYHQWAERLEQQLDSKILGINGIVTAHFIGAEDAAPTDGVIVDVKSPPALHGGGELYYPDRVHEAVSFITLTEPPHFGRIALLK